MTRFVKFSSLFLVIFLSGCQAVGQGQTSLYERYSQKNGHKAYSIGTNGKAGASWNASSVAEAVELANETCRKDGGINCNVTEIDGRPATNFNSSVDNSTPMAKSVDAVSKPLLLPGAFGVQPMTFTEIENNECNIINTNSITTVPQNLEVELSNVAYMMSGNRYHITKIINANGSDSISVIADIYRCKQRSLASK